MKKNIAMRVAAILFILTMISTCAFSTTFAKYVTSGEATDTARVAKFGVVVSQRKVDSTPVSAFSTSYEKTDNSFTLSANTVVSSDDDKLMAPGTNGEITYFDVTGTPEVAVRLSYKATIDLGDNWKDASNNYYCPLVISIKYGTEEVNISGIGYSTVEEFEVAIKGAIDACTEDLDANTKLNSNKKDIKISWSWAFETGANDVEKAANNVKDTFLGDEAAADRAATVSFTITCTVTQLD